MDADPGPAVVTRVRPKMSDATDAVTKSAPRTSLAQSEPPRAPLGSAARATSQTATTSGTLIRKTARQPSACVSRPPSTSPTVKPAEAVELYHESARSRARPDGKTATITA